MQHLKKGLEIAQEAVIPPRPMLTKKVLNSHSFQTSESRLCCDVIISNLVLPGFRSHALFLQKQRVRYII